MFNKKAFAIRIEDTKPTRNKAALYEIFAKAAKDLPDFTVEGINKSFKKEPAIEKVPLVKATTLTGEIEAGIIKRVPRNFICVGVSKRADVTFEKESSIRLNAFVSLVPIFDLEKHFNIIVARIAEYLLGAYGWKPLEAAKKKAKKAKKAKKTVTVIKSRISSLLESPVRKTTVLAL